VAAWLEGDETGQLMEKQLTLGERKLNVTPGKLVLLFLAVLFVLRVVEVSRTKWAVHRNFSPSQVDEYLYHGIPELIKSPYDSTILPKVIVIDRQKEEIDLSVFHKLPGSLRAHSPDEVNTVVWTEYGRKEVGVYIGANATAFRRTCKVYVVDPKAQRIKYVRHFTGDSPTRTTIRHKEHTDIVGPPPLNKIAAFIKDYSVH